MERNINFSRHHNAGLAFVAPSGIVRGIYTAVNGHSRPVYPSRAVATIDETYKWVCVRLKHAAGSQSSATDSPSAKPALRARSDDRFVTPPVAGS
ncbi:MAG: hypothetical protein HRU17_24310 [Polyangiaceae bacterium]|nr:hypothetical protein [Polyangiaceae bacterium]